MNEPKILYCGPMVDFSGYSEIARNYVRALNNAGCNIVTRDFRYDGGDYQRDDVESALAIKSLKDVKIVIMNTTPNETEYKEDLFNISIFCWETDRIPQLWVDCLNKMQLVIVPCRSNLIAAKSCGVTVPIELIPYSFDIKKYSQKPTPYIIPQVNERFKFLSICQFSKKKAVDPLLKAYFTEFDAQEPVVLILKVYVGPNDGDAERQRIQGLIQAMREILRLKEYPPVLLIHKVMSHEDIARLYSTSDCYVLPSRGEGWGVPHFDAMGYSIPTIATKGTGPEEFITSQCGWLVDSNSSPVCDMPHPHDFLYTGKENWREPHVGHLKECMREAFILWGLRDDNPAWNKMGEAAKARASEFSNDIIGPQLRDVIMKYYGMWKNVN